MNLRVPPGLFNPNATPLADLTLVAYVLIFAPLMLIGFVFARRRMYEPAHKLTMTFITVSNWGLILFVMAVSYGMSVRPELPEGLSQLWVLLPTIHLIVGGLAQLLATYLLFRMWFENELPGWLKVRRIKPFMRLTLLLWLLTITLGVITYVMWYTPLVAGDAPPATVLPAPDTPAATPGLGQPAVTPELADSASTPVPTKTPAAAEPAVVPTATFQPGIPTKTPLAAEPATTPEAAG